ncbi:MAG: Do family serine endopeptidase [Spongiibacteraceae bacterium]
MYHISSFLRNLLSASRQSAFVLLACLAASSASLALMPAADAQGAAMPSLAPMLKRVNPAVVNISTFTTRAVQQNPLLSDPFFRRFFNIPQQQMPQQRRRTQSAGSGVIIDAAAGTVLTNHHVIKGADEITVSLEDGRSYKATLVGSDPDVDVAVLKIDADNLHSVKLSNSDALEVGDYVVAIGNPFGLGQTVTTGIVSALGRSGLGIEGYENFIQTDASINPGNSGGALVNLRGELVGINTAILAPAGGNVGIGFAIPVNMARLSLEQILDHGEVKRGQLGVVIQSLTPSLAEAFGLDRQQRGAVIAEVQKGSAADKAGLQEGDIIIEIDEKSIRGAAQLRNAIGLQRIGNKTKVVVLREGRRKTFVAKLQPVQKKQLSADVGGKLVGKLLDGASLEDLGNDKGVGVTAVAPATAAMRAGLQPGDKIVSVNQRLVKNIADFISVAEKADQRLLLRVIRGRAAMWIVLRDR